MPRKYIDEILDEPPKKKSFTIPDCNRLGLETGEILTDLVGKRWKLGKCIGLGGFGVIHDCHQENSKKKNEYVMKIESHSSGPLFVEINCYLRIAKKEMIKKWKEEKGLSNLGMPNYVASGSHITKDNKYRFLVLPKYKQNLEQILQKEKLFNLKTTLLISKQILSVLEYLHSQGYIHSDIKAANIMLETKFKNKFTSPIRPSGFSKSPISNRKSKYPRLRACTVKKLNRVKISNRYDTRKTKYVNYNEDSFPYKVIEKEIKKEQLFLIDFGLASKFKLSTGEHKKYEDERKAHAGTLLFCSRDAHKGIQSRRSDLETLAYNMVYWLTGSLPWIEDLDNPEMIERKKKHCFKDVLGFLYFCMDDPPTVLKEFFDYIKNLNIEETPNYNACQQLFTKSLNDNGYENDENFDFENLEGWGIAEKKKPNKVKLDEFKRPPLLSNMPIKPVLRKKIKEKKINAALNWSKMLSNPEVLMKKSRDRKTCDTAEPSFHCFDIESLNPTQTMREIYSRYQERRGQSPREYNEDNFENSPQGFTSAMVAVWQKMIAQKALEETINLVKKKKKKRIIKKNNNNYVRELSKAKAKTVLPTRTYSLRGS